MQHKAPCCSERSPQAFEKTENIPFFVFANRALFCFSFQFLLQCLNHMFYYAPNNPLARENLLIRILCLISVFKDCPFGFLINTTEHLQGAFIVLGKGNNNVSRLSCAVRSDNN